MSIMQEYEQIKREIGEDRYNVIAKYLVLHKDILLSDIYYTREGWNKFKEWYETEAK